MPSLLKYFAVVGAALVAVLMLAHSILDTGVRPQQVAAAPKPVVQHHPGASLIERWRNEQAAMKATKEGKPQVVAAPATPIPAAETGTTIVTPTVAPPPAAPAPVVAAAPEPPQVSAPVALTTAPVVTPVIAASDPVADEEAEKAEKLKAAKAEKARKRRIARERARQREIAQHQTNPYDRAPHVGYRVVEAPYAYAPQRPAFDLFGRQRTW